jgi:hypothetical protein
MLYILFRLKQPGPTPHASASSDPWFQGLRVWTEIGEICESESFGKSPKLMHYMLFVTVGYLQMATAEAL